MKNKQIQKSGNNSQQYQFTNSTVIVGITEERARDIYNEMYEIVSKNYTDEANRIASKRVNDLKELIMDKVDKVNDIIESFSNPAFQFFLKKLQNSAAASDRVGDLKILTELLVHRVENKNDRKITASVTRAVEIIDEIDDDALIGMTMMYVISSYMFTSGDISRCINDMNDLFSQLNYRELPNGTEWLDHLEILGTIRISPVSSLKKFKDIYISKFNGYTCAGIRLNSENYFKAIEILRKFKISTNILVNHELNHGYVRLAIPGIELIPNLLISLNENDGKITTRKINSDEINALYQIWDLYSTEQQINESVQKSFIEIIDKYEILRIIHNWWDNIPLGNTITQIGRTIAHANTKIYISDFPNMEL